MRNQGAMLSTGMGQLGGLYVTDTSAHTGNFGVIYAVQTAVINTLVSANEADGSALMRGTLTAIPLPAGATIWGHFTSITLDSGKVFCYDV